MTKVALLQAFYRLMRFDKPIGIALLAWPTIWALEVAFPEGPPWPLVGYFLAGTVCMRAAGCVINDIADRRIDPFVERTQHRPLAAGQLTLSQAWGCLIGLLVLALGILLQLPIVCFKYAIVALFLVFLYPFCKRFMPTPQGILALAFSMGIPMVYAAAGVPFAHTMWLLSAINLLWVLAYDTIYALGDQAEDSRLGVHSTARYWGDHARKIIMGLQGMMLCLWFLLGYSQGYSVMFYGFLILMGGLILRQAWWLSQPEKSDWFQAFLISQWVGALGGIGILIGKI